MRRRRRDTATPRSEEPGTTIIRLAGDMTTPNGIAEFASRVIGRLGGPSPHVVVDLRDVTAADTKLVAAIVVAHRQRRQCNRRLTIRASGEVGKWLSLCRLDGLAEA